MSKAIFALFALLVVSQAAVADNNKLILHKTEYGYLANVNLTTKATTPSKVGVFLYSSMAVIRSDDFKCTAENSCEKTPDWKSVPLPYVNQGGSAIRAPLDIGVNNWKLSKYSPAVKASSYWNERNADAGKGVDAWIGLGFEKAKKNFLNGATNFSLYLNKTDFVVDFSPEINASKAPSATFKTNANFIIEDARSIKMGNFTEDLNGYKLMFDVNFEGIAVPRALYNIIVAHMNYRGFYCKDFIIPDIGGIPPKRVKCNYGGEFHKLPKILITVGKNSLITITPAMYAKEANQGEFTLNLIPTLEMVSGISYVNPTFSDYIILGHPVLAAYETLFDVKDSSIKLYRKH